MTLYRLKPLDWQKGQYGQVVKTPVATLHLNKRAGGDWHLWSAGAVYGQRLDSKHATHEEAKAAAQEYFERRMLEGLSEATVEEIEDACFGKEVMDEHRHSVRVNMTKMLDSILG